jgi:sorbitol-specific phosphotransferase system component IIBC
MKPVAKLAVISVLRAKLAEVNEFSASLSPVIVPLIICSLVIELSAILSPVMAPFAILEDVIALSAILSTVMAKGAIFSLVTAPF